MRRAFAQGNMQLAPGGRQAQTVFVAPVNGDGGSYSANKSVYSLEFVLPDTNALISAEHGLRLRGRIKAGYKTSAGTKEYVYLSPRSGLHGMIKSIVITSGSTNQVLERVQNYSRLATTLVNMTSNDDALSSKHLLEAFVLGSLVDAQDVDGIGFPVSHSLIGNEIGNLNARRFNFQLETGISKGRQDIPLRVHGGIRIQIDLNLNQQFLYCPGLDDPTTAERYVSNAEFEIEDVTLQYTNVYMNQPANMDMSAPGNGMPGNDLVGVVSPTTVYQAFSDSITTVQNSYASVSFAPGLPACSTILFNFLSSVRQAGHTDPQALNNYSIDRLGVTINGERVSFFDVMSAIQAKIAAYEALGSWHNMQKSTRIDQMDGFFGLPLDTYTAGPNVNGANRPSLSFYIEQIKRDDPAYNGAPVGKTVDDLIDTDALPALMFAFFLGTRAVSPSTGGMNRAIVL